MYRFTFICLLSCASSSLEQLHVGPFYLAACQSTFYVTPDLDPAQIEAVAHAALYWNTLLEREQFIDGGSVDVQPSPVTTRIVMGNMENECGTTHWRWYGTGCITDVDIVLSSDCDRRFTTSNFETVVRHELGHALGLGHSPDRTSVMYYQASLYSADAKELTPSETAEFRAYYGVE